MKIYVGTQNALKVRATQSAFAKTFPRESVLVESIAVDTNVPSQPFAEQIVKGAISRACSALGQGDFGVGIEAGLVTFPGCDCPFSVQFCAIVDQSGRITSGHGPGYELPESIVKRLPCGSTLEREIARIAGLCEAGRATGAIGYLSEGQIDRFAITCQAVLMALIPRIKNGLYSS